LTVPDDPDSPFFAEALLRAVWDPGGNPRLAAIERVVLVHRLREVLALVGFTRFEAAGTDEKGELDLEGITAAALSPEPEWFPAVENRGEGIFVVLSAEVIAQWRNREGVRQRERQLLRGKLAWDAEHSSANRHWLGVPYVLLHSLSHLLLTRIALDCGYPAAALRERIYALPEAGMYGLLIHTGTSDSEGTLGGLVETGRRIGEHPRGHRGCPSVLERSGLRRTRSERRARSDAPARRRLPRLPADRRDELRAAQRLARSGAGGADAHDCGRGTVSVTADPLPAIRALPAKALSDLAGALRGGRVTGAVSAFSIRNAVPAIGETAAAELSSLLASGLGVPHAALLLDVLAAEQTRHRDAAIELVTSGPDMIGSTRDTGVVFRELFAAADRRVLVVGFAVHQGREMFAALAARMYQLPDLAVRLCLDVRRVPGDTTRADAIARRFAERFVRQEWPGSRLPEIFYDPRSLAEADARRASLHAKCIVIDGTRALIGSANLTEAAHMRNIEVGIVVSGVIVAAVERHFDALITAGRLRPLLLGT